jgi:IstB-like ATP binding protein
LIEQLARAEIDERSRRSMERRLRYSGIKGFKPMADFDWNWPAKIERDVIERALTLDFLSESRNLVLVGRNGLGKTMIAQNICHAAVLAGSSVFFRCAPALLEDLHRQTPEGRRQQQMYMIGRHRSAHNYHVPRLADLANQVARPLRYSPPQYLVSILCAPDHVVLKVEDRVRPMPVFRHSPYCRRRGPGC